MKQARCPHCKKKRRKAEGDGQRSATRPEKRWKYFPGIGMVCFMCAYALDEAAKRKQFELPEGQKHPFGCDCEGCEHFRAEHGS
jgi:hypothetical protein